MVDVVAKAVPDLEGRLRDLTDEEFRDRYDCDRFTATVLSNRFRYVASHMANQLRTHAFSPIMRDAADLCAMVSGPPEMKFPMVAVSETLPLFNGSIPDGVRIALEEYGVERLRPGDSVLVNDSYRVGTHFNDVCNIRPIFYRDEQVGALTLRAHMLDIGGPWASDSMSLKRNTWHTGLRLPPMLLYAGGLPVRETFKLLYANTRLGRLIVPDLRTIFHSLQLGEQLLTATIDKHGLEAFFGAMRYVCDVSAETTRDALLDLPDGVYEGEEWVDGDGLPDSPEYCVRVRITKVGERAEFDLRGSSPATRSGMNCAWPDVKTAVALALKLLIDQKSPVTSGTLTNVDVVVPPDAVFNPYPPHGCYGYFEPVMMIVHAIFQALNPALGANAVTASSPFTTIHVRAETPDGTDDIHPTLALHTLCGPWGATKHGDGDSTQQNVCQNLMMVGGVEAFEVERMNSGLPAVALRSEYVIDSGGAGTHRGGAASAHDLLHLFAAEHEAMEFHAKRPVAGGGVYGGEPGPTAAIWIWDVKDSGGVESPQFFPATLADPVYSKAVLHVGRLSAATKQADPMGEYFAADDKVRLESGAVSRMLTQGGGGWGDPLDRDPERVKADVRDEYVTPAAAARDYGVVVEGDPLLDPEGLVVDQGATHKLRSQLRAERG